MALPSKSKTWQYIWNTAQTTSGNALTDAQNAMYTLVSKLLALRNAVDGSGNPTGATPIFICVGSSDKTTNFSAASTTAQTNYWASASNCVYTSTPNFGSWIVLKNQGSGLTNPYYFLIGLQSSGSFYYPYVGISYAGFTGGGLNSYPTATDLFSPAGAGSAASTTLQSQSWWPTNGSATIAWSGKIHVLASTDGTSVRFLVSYNGFTQQAYFFEQPASAVAGWTNPFVVFNNSINGVSMTYAANFLTNALVLGATVNTSIRGNPNSLAASPLLPTVVTGLPAITLVNTTYLEAATNLPNDLDGSWPMCSAILIGTATSGWRGQLGTLADLWFGSAAAGDLSTYPNDATRQFVQFANVILPNNGTVVVAT